MPAEAIPEVIEPGELYIPDGKVGYSVNAAALPNTDPSLLLTEVAGLEDFQAYQDQDADHLLTPGACALSFWIRRNQNFDSGSAGLSVNTVVTPPIQTASRFLMGVMDPLAVSLSPTDRTVTWAIFTYSASALQFVQLGWINTYYWLTSNAINLVTGQWHLVVINRDPATFTQTVTPGQTGLHQIYLDGNLIGNNTTPNWTFYPDPVNAQRFGIGDLTTLGRTVGGAAGGAAVDLAKICFHDQKVSPVEQLGLIDSMKYGGPT